MTENNGAILPIESVWKFTYLFWKNIQAQTLSYQPALVCLAALIFFFAVFFFGDVTFETGDIVTEMVS